MATSKEVEDKIANKVTITKRDYTSRYGACHELKSILSILPMDLFSLFMQFGHYCKGQQILGGKMTSDGKESQKNENIFKK